MVSNYSKKAYHRFGCSATPYRTDGTDILIHAATGPKIVDISASTLIERGFLVPPKVHFYRMKPDWNKPVPKDYQNVYTKFIVENEERNEKIVKLADYMAEKGERVVILVQRQQHGKILEEMLQKKGRMAKFIFGETCLTERSMALDQFSAGVLDVLLGSSILNEGIDVPCITALINAAAGKSSSSYYQKIGRAIRPFENKTRAIVIDFIDAVKWLDKHSKERIKVLKTEPLYQIKIQEHD
jgi:superfamily II DNA or RNA helicase